MHQRQYSLAISWWAMACETGLSMKSSFVYLGDLSGGGWVSHSIYSNFLIPNVLWNCCILWHICSHLGLYSCSYFSYLRCLLLHCNSGDTTHITLLIVAVNIMEPTEILGAMPAAHMYPSSLLPVLYHEGCAFGESHFADHTISNIGAKKALTI